MNRIWTGLLCALAASGPRPRRATDPMAGRSRYDYPFYSNVYAGFSFGQLRYSEEGLDTITPATATVVRRAPLSPNLAIEGRFGGGLGSAQANSYGIEVHSLFAGYLKGSVPLAPGFSLYGLGGVANVDLRRDFGLRLCQ